MEIIDKYTSMEYFTTQTYREYMEYSKNSKETSRVLNKLLLSFLNDTFIPNNFSQIISPIKKKLTNINNMYLKELKNILEYDYNYISDLNSVMMGIPNDTDSDIDFTVAVNSLDQQERITKKLKLNGYQLVHEWVDKLPNQKSSEIPWKDFIKYHKEVQIEVKVRWIKVVDVIMKAHINIKDHLTDLQKTKISYIKSVLSKGDKKIYKTFKYIIYGAMFEGHEDSVIFKHD